MAKHKNNIIGYPYVVIDESGFLELYTHDGHKVNANIFIRVQDGFGDTYNTVIAKFPCNIVGSKAEMMDEIKSAGEVNKNIA
jgi:hypothetical protein